MTNQDREAKRKELERQIDRDRIEFITHINRFRLQPKYNRDARKTPNPPANCLDSLRLTTSFAAVPAKRHRTEYPAK